MYSRTRAARCIPRALINGICHPPLRCISRFMLYVRSTRFILRFMLHTECAARIPRVRVRVRACVCIHMRAYVHNTRHFYTPFLYALSPHLRANHTAPRFVSDFSTPPAERRFYAALANCRISTEHSLHVLRYLIPYSLSELSRLVFPLFPSDGNIPTSLSTLRKKKK